MPAIDLSQMTPTEKFDLIGALWDSLDHDAGPLTDAQAAEIEHRLVTLDEDIEQGETPMTCWLNFAPVIPHEVL